MPSRWICLGIVLCWIAVNGLLFWRDMLPRLLPGQPPPYAVELVEEAQTNRASVSWAVFFDDNPKEVARIKTRVEHPRRDVFELVSLFKPVNLQKPVPYGADGRLLLEKVESAYLVNSAGDLLGVKAHIDAKEASGIPVEFDLLGEVEAGSMTPRLHAALPGGLFKGKKGTIDLATMGDVGGSALLLPLHPMNRIHGLSPGQTWTVHVLDPLAPARWALHGFSDDGSLAHAAVRRQEEAFTFANYEDVACLVIDYEGVDLKVRTWVARKDDQVMCQEATLGKTRWTINRE
jgi:hypothetical protein